MHWICQGRVLFVVFQGQVDGGTITPQRVTSQGMGVLGPCFDVYGPTQGFAYMGSHTSGEDFENPSIRWSKTIRNCMFPRTRGLVLFYSSHPPQKRQKPWLFQLSYAVISNTLRWILKKTSILTRVLRQGWHVGLKPISE